MATMKISVAAPVFAGNEMEYVRDCIESTWISSAGKYIGQFEKEFAEFCRVDHALSVANGTLALHLALLGLGIGPGDEVIVPTFTYVATANCVVYCGATPVFVDCEPDTWNIDPAKIEAAITPRTKAIIPVHIFGHPCDMDPILDIAARYHLIVVEDAAEAHGAEYKGRRAGGLGLVSAFSFFGNKIITTGEGGMVTTNDTDLAAKMRQIKGQGMDLKKRYWFPMIGYNYRMTNIEAAIGLAQLEKIDWHLAQRRRVIERYRKNLSNKEGITLQPERENCKNSYWMTSVVLDDDLLDRDKVMQLMTESGIETRPFFYCMHQLPMYQESAKGCSFPVADRVSAHGINLPSSAKLTDQEIDYVCETLIRILHI